MQMNASVFYLLQHQYLFSNRINTSPESQTDEQLLQEKYVSPPDAVHVSAARNNQLIQSFFRRHMAFDVILGQSTDRNGGWWWLMSVSVSPGVWNARLFPLNLI